MESELVNASPFSHNSYHNQKKSQTNEVGQGHIVVDARGKAEVVSLR